MNNRYTLFGVTILLGLILSLYAVWVLIPAGATDASPALLRQDFKADYTLMVAEAFHADQDVERAMAALAFLDEDNPLAPVVAALEFGQNAGYSQQDIGYLAVLAEALPTYDPSLDATPTP